MKLIIISGLSGSGKTVALHTLEDEDYYCVDNLPLGLLSSFVSQLLTQKIRLYDNIAVGIDARSHAEDLHEFSHIINELRHSDIDIEVIYIQAERETLVKRFSDTRRKHPLTRKGLPLCEAIEIERTLLKDVALAADLYIDTTYTNIHQLREHIKTLVVRRQHGSLSILFQSFGFKNGAPVDSDFVFDVRCLPNPHWEPALRPLTGQDPEVIKFLQSQQDVQEMLQYLRDFLRFLIPRFTQQNRFYLTVSIGCTGGQHRSVFIAEQLHDDFKAQLDNVSLRHRELT